MLQLATHARYCAATFLSKMHVPLHASTYSKAVNIKRACDKDRIYLGMLSANKKHSSIRIYCVVKKAFFWQKYAQTALSQCPSCVGSNP